MAKRISVNGEQVELPKDSITGGELKDSLRFNRDSSVVAVGQDGQNVFVADNQALPADAREVSIIPRFEYGF